VLSLDVYDVQRRPTLVQVKQIIMCDCSIVSGAEVLVSQGKKKATLMLGVAICHRCLGRQKLSVVWQVVGRRSQLCKWVLGEAKGCVL